MRIAVAALGLNHIPGDVDIPRQHAVVRVTAEDKFNPTVRKPLDLPVQALQLERRDLGLRGRAPVAERAGERTAPIRLPQRHPMLLRIGLHQRREDVFEIWRGNTAEVLNARRLGIPDDRSVIPPIADGGDCLPVLRVGVLENGRGRHLAPAVAREVKKWVLLQERLISIGHVGPAEDDDDIGLALLQRLRHFDGNSEIPHIEAEEDNVRLLEMLDGPLHWNSGIERQQEPNSFGTLEVCLRIGLQQTDRQRQIVLIREAVIDLDKAHGHARLGHLTLRRTCATDRGLQSATGPPLPAARGGWQPYFPQLASSSTCRESPSRWRDTTNKNAAHAEPGCPLGWSGFLRTAGALRPTRLAAHRTIGCDDPARQRRSLD